MQATDTGKKFRYVAVALLVLAIGLAVAHFKIYKLEKKTKDPPPRDMVLPFYEER